MIAVVKQHADLWNELLARQYLQVFQTNCNNARHNNKKVCQSSALGTDGTILRTSISLHILERSSLSSAKECLVYLLYVVWSCYYQTSSFKMQDSQIDKIRQRELLSLIPSCFSLFAKIPSSMKQSRLRQYSLRNSTNSLPFRAPKVGTQICCSGEIHSSLTSLLGVWACAPRALVCK